MKTSNKLAAICFFAVAALSVGCSSGAYETGTASEMRTSDMQTKNQDYGYSAVVKFPPGGTNLDEAAKTRLRDVALHVGVRNISRAEIASWSDKAFPKTGPDLPKADRDLADRRAKTVDKFLREELELSGMRTRIYSMAETSNWMARMFQTDEAELKSVFAKESEAPMARADFNTIMDDGGPMKVIVVFIRK